MKRDVLPLAVSVLFILFSSLAAGTIYYHADHLSANQWKYSYTIANDSLSEPIKGFTIWFDDQNCTNLSESIDLGLSGHWQNDWLYGVASKGDGFDFYTTDAGNIENTTLSGISIEFTWLGSGAPGSQYYEIYDTTTYSTIESGQTVLVPEPATLLLMVGGIALVRNRKRA